MIRIIWNNLTPPGYTQEDVFDTLVSPAVFHNPELKDKIQNSSFYRKKKKGSQEEIDLPTEIRKNKTSRSRLFSFQPESGSICERMMALLLLKTEEENVPYTMETFPVRQLFKKQWKKILTPGSEEVKKPLTKEEVASFRKYIALFWNENSRPEDYETCIREWKTSRITRQLTDVKVSFSCHDQEIRLEDLLTSIRAGAEELFLERLATMSVIACVWYLWEESGQNHFYVEQLLRLSRMIFPDDAIPHGSKTPNKTRTPFPDENEDNRNAEEALAEVRALLSARQYQKAGALCEKIFETYKCASDHAIGTALAHLVECCENGYKKPSKFGSLDDIRKEAVNRQCIYISKQRNSILSAPVHDRATSTGTFVLNAENRISKEVMDTAPRGWSGMISSTPDENILPGINQRMILINDDLDQNLRDALSILDRIKNDVDSGRTVISDWKNLEICIRCQEEEVTPILDTALSFFTESTSMESDGDSSVIRIHLIDEAKRSAEHLFAKHPHFYPLTFAGNQEKEEKTIRLVIVSDNPDQNYVKWLIKEGFWTLPRFDTNISTRITVLSPEASEIGYSILSECQGLEGFSVIHEKPAGKPLEINDIRFPLIEYRQTSFTDRSLANVLKNTFSSDDFLYYIVDAASDLEGIKLGTRIREWSVRSAVNTGRIGTYSKKNHIIAIHCQDADYAALARELIIPKEEEHASRWFNDYNFIPWGSLEDLYSWDQLTGGILETLAQCIHLQYCGSSFQEEDCRKNLVSYFRRLYNHDSSFAAAVSLPYRLFEAGVIPRAWFIQNPDAWWNEKTRKEMAEKYRKKLYPSSQEPDKELLTRLARYEHMRWCCFQLTRGFMPVEDEQQVIQYMIAGSTRHSLQIAKLHPCICSWKDLRSLHKMLSDAAARKISYEDYEEFLSIKKEDPKQFETAITPYLDKRFRKFFAPDDDYSAFQRIDDQNISQTADILETKWQTDRVSEPAESEKT